MYEYMHGGCQTSEVRSTVLSLSYSVLVQQGYDTYMTCIISDICVIHMYAYEQYCIAGRHDIHICI